MRPSLGRSNSPQTVHSTRPDPQPELTDTEENNMAHVRESLDQATIVIAGASSGFGRGAALELGRQGANVVVAARRTDLIEELAAEVRGAGGSALATTVDVSCPDDIDRLRQTALDRFGHLDVWINNVGVGALGLFWDIPLDVHARVVDVNLKGLIYGAHAALNIFTGQDAGTLINVASIDSEVPLALQNTYAATKAAVLSLTRSLNQELRLSGHQDTVKVAAVMPWAVDTPWWDHAANYTGHTPRMAAMDDPQIVVKAIVEACLNPREEIPVGPKARASDLSHHLFPDLTERLSANIANRQRAKGTPVPPTTGTLFEPMESGRAIDGGVRQRMANEDANA
jgi:short-subunit dehydrogenase